MKGWVLFSYLFRDFSRLCLFIRQEAISTSASAAGADPQARLRIVSLTRDGVCRPHIRFPITFECGSAMHIDDSKPLSVLAVDDDPALLRLIAKTASNAGYHVVTAGDGQEALDLIRTDCPDLIITDWDMPRLDGLQLCRKLREQKLAQYVFVLLLTAKTCSEDMVAGLNAGADDFLSKPVEPTVLLARLKAGSRTVAMERRLRNIARLDPLTSLANRRTFHEGLCREWDRSLRYGRPLACVMVDLDFFKAVNDEHGHAAGDAVLQGVSRVLEDHRRSSDVLARYGGEEFCVLLTETDEDGAAVWAERAREAIVKASFSVAGQDLHITGSLGVAARLPDTPTPEALVALSDEALGVAKQSGRNRVVCFSSLADVGPTQPAGPNNPWLDIVASDVMSPAVYSPHQDDKVEQVADMFLQLRLNAAPVVDDEGLLVGMISENDILAVSSSARGRNTAIRQCMKTNVICYDQETPARSVHQFLARASVPRVIVVAQGRPVGVISRATLLRWLRNWSNVGRGESATQRVERAQDRRAGILKTAETASERLGVLSGYLARHDTDFVPCAVAEATRLEELAHEILAHCRQQDRL